MSTELDDERDTRKRYADYLRHRINELLAEAAAKKSEADGLQEALTVLNQMHQH